MVSPKWQTMWIESQHCSKSIVNVPLPSQQAKKILEDLRTSCCSPNKAVQVEALKCWGLWIQNQNPDDWKLNTVCFTAVRPLITKKLQPLHKDVDICKMKLELMWALLVKVQDMMQLEGPQYILEVFLQSCLTWLSSTTVDDSEQDIFLLIFQLLLSVLNKNETLTGCDKEVFPPLSEDILHVKKVFHRVADKFLNLFVYWRKIEDRSVILKIWKRFLEHCEQSYEHIPIPVWHKVFKLAGQICSEKDVPVKERLAFLHSCATTIKSALTSSKFIDFGNLLTTPCEVLLKKLVELCTIECEEFGDSEMFLHSKEICEVLSSKSVAINGYDLCISVLDVLEEFCLRSLFWGVWCGLVYCYKSLLMGTHQSQLTKIELKFFRKLRGFVVNFELDRKDLHEDCVKEVERHIGLLSIGCVCSYKSVEVSETQSERSEPEEKCVFNGASNKIVPLMPKCALGSFSFAFLQKRKNFSPRKTLSVNFDLIKDVLNTLSLNSTKSLLSSTFTFRFVSLRSADDMEIVPRTSSLPLGAEVRSRRKGSAEVCCREKRASSPKPPCTPVKKTGAPSEGEERAEGDEEVISTPTTRSKRRAEEERKRELEMQKRRKRRSFEVLVQEIVRKNKERKTEKNNKRRKGQDGLKGKRSKRKVVKEKSLNSGGKRKKSSEDSDRKLRNSTKAENVKIEKSKEKTLVKTKGKLENYFKVITKKSGNETKKEMKKPSTKGKKRTNQSSCCKSEKEGERRGEIGWRQTSLKTMMNPKIKLEKIKQGLRTRDKTVEVAQEKPKLRKDREGNEEKVKKEERKDKKGVEEKVKKEERKDKKGVEEKVKNEGRKDKKGVEDKVKNERRNDRKGTEEKVNRVRKGTKEMLKSEIKKDRKVTEEKEKNEERKDREGMEEKVKKDREGTEEKIKNEGKKGKNVFNQSPFKEVFHDHEYAKMKPLEKMAEAKKTNTAGKRQREKDPGETDSNKTSKPEFLVAYPEVIVPEKSKVEEDKSPDVEALPSSVQVSMSKLEESVLGVTEVAELSAWEEPNLKKTEVHEETKWVRMMEPTTKKSIEVDEELDKSTIEVVEVSLMRTNVCFNENNLKPTENESVTEKRAKKRMREFQIEESNKKMRLEEEDETFEDLPLPLEITEKENLEEKHPEMVSPMKKEKTGCLTSKQNGSSKAVSSGMSRALRIIGLVPESSKGRSWESSPRTEALKCLKAPNVDKNSRASKMLALLSENIVEPEEAAKACEEEVNSNHVAMATTTTTPNSKTPTSSLKSPKSIKKRRSIRFDDAKNETVLYQTDTPPSQILEEREKRRGTRPFVMAVTLP